MPETARYQTTTIQIVNGEAIANQTRTRSLAEKSVRRSPSHRSVRMTT